MSSKEYAYNDPLSIGVRRFFSLLKWIIPLSFVFLIFIMIVGNFWATVPNGHVGLKNTFGKVSEETLNAGLTFKSPFTRIVNFNMKMEKLKLDNIEASDKDGQKVFADIVINYKIKDMATARKIYTTIGDPESYANILALGEKAQEGFKKTTVNYEALEILEKRDLVKDEARDNIFGRLPTDVLEIESISIIDIRYTQSFDNAIQRKKDAEQLALASENEVKVAEAEAKKQIAKAEGEKQVTILKAEAEAEALRIQKEAIANAPELLELRRIERDKEAILKWNGVMPQYVLGGGTMPFINIGG